MDPSELERLRMMAPTPVAVGAGAGAAAYSGAQVVVSRANPAGGASGAGAPSRALMQQLHEAGMADALPGDVAALLRRRPMTMTGPRSTQQGPATPLAMDIEARDPRSASDIVLQLLAYRPAAGLDALTGGTGGMLGSGGGFSAPRAPTSLYFTLQFYHFAPITTEPCLLASASAVLGPQGGEAAAGEERPTYVLLPTAQVRVRQFSALASLMFFDFGRMQR